MLANAALRNMCGGLAVLGASVAAYAADKPYPAKPVRVIVPFPPGGSADPLARHFGAWLSEKLGEPFISDNRPGAGTAIAHTLAARATPDGYTLILGAGSGLGTNPAFGYKLDYDPVKDFAPVSLAAYVPQLIVVFPGVPAKNFNDLIALTKSQPGKIAFGTPGAGSIGHFSEALIGNMTGVKFVHVPYKGAGPAVLDLVAGRIQVFCGSVTGTQPQITAGRIRALATGHAKRLKSMPDLPTVAETLPGFTNDGWYGIFGPAGTPAPVIQKVHDEMQRALANAEFAKFIETIGMVPAGSTPKELGDWVKSELGRWTKAGRDAGISLNQK